MRNLVLLIAPFLFLFSCSTNTSQDVYAQTDDSICVLQQSIDSLTKELQLKKSREDSLLQCIVTLQKEKKYLKNQLLQIKSADLQTIDIQLIKKQSYLKNSKFVDCSCLSGSILEEQICINIELQKNDSILHVVLDSIMAIGDNEVNNLLQIEQQYWEYYRYAFASSYVDSQFCSNRVDMVLYMKKATQVTKDRVRYLRNRVNNN